MSHGFHNNIREILCCILKALIKKSPFVYTLVFFVWRNLNVSPVRTRVSLVEWFNNTGHRVGIPCSVVSEACVQDAKTFTSFFVNGLGIVLRCLYIAYQVSLNILYLGACLQCIICKNSNSPRKKLVHCLTNSCFLLRLTASDTW